MTSLFRQLEQWIPTVPGWATVDKAQRLAAMVIALSARTSVEIGVFGGRGVLAMALAHKYLGRGTAIGIDPWTNDAAMEGYTGENREWWGGLNLEQIYQGFERQIDALGCRNVIQVFRCKSDDFRLPDEIDLLHLDGQHTEQAVRDMERFAPRVRAGGIIVLDDLTWANDGVCSVPKAAEWLTKNGFIELCRVLKKYPDGSKDDWAAFQKVNDQAQRRQPEAPPQAQKGQAND